MHERNAITAERFDLVLEAIRCHGATVEQAAHYSGLRPDALREHLRSHADLLVEIAMARRTYVEPDMVA